MRYGQLVIGPAGSGKSTYTSTIQKHCKDLRRLTYCANLDPAAEYFDYDVAVDVRDLISVEDVFEELNYGPNGGLIYCMEYLLENISWLTEEIGDYEDDYWIFDCPGQIELYSHSTIVREIVEHLERMDFRICAVYLLDSQFIQDPSKFFGGCLSSMSAMIRLELPHVNILNKMDIIGSGIRKKELESFLAPDPRLISEELSNVTERCRKLNEAIADLVDSYSLVSFIPLNREDPESVYQVLHHIDFAIQYGENLEPKETLYCVCLFEFIYS
ncbi:hypothetical protein Zmor_012168 [Zophobas morio]|uniref:GPN-loop GTPase 3 n=1 Tax=Zophobas morio TaxID=2755281 RepID=A0AA38LZU9_9CUCU|nr:hypothetical protein Zmor_012168 [Zophobas morio]